MGPTYYIVPLGRTIHDRVSNWVMEYEMNWMKRIPLFVLKQYRIKRHNIGDPIWCVCKVCFVIKCITRWHIYICVYFSMMWFLVYKRGLCIYEWDEKLDTSIVNSAGTFWTFVQMVSVISFQFQLISRR